MTLGFGNAKVALEAAATVEQRFQRVTARAGLAMPGQPGMPRPTLDGSPDNMDLQTADVVHHQACRWLEYTETLVAISEAKLGLLRTEAKHVREKAKFRHGASIDKWPEEAIEQCHKLEGKLAEEEAYLVLLNGMHDSLQKVRVAASRTITRHSRSTMNVG